METETTKSKIAGRDARTPVDVVLAADLGGTNIRMAAVDSVGSVRHLTKKPVPKGVSPDDLMSLIGRMSDEIRGRMASDERLCAVAFTAPAPVPADFDGILTKLPNLGSITGMNFKAALESHFNLPVKIENDATAAAIGENWIGASCDVQSSIVATLGTGIGGGIIIDNEPLRGKDGIGGEIGHFTVEPNGRQCKCGNRGCVEEYASATAILRIAREQGMDVTSSYDVYRAWQSGDAAAKQVFDTMAGYLGQMLASLTNSLNPEMLVICGGVAEGFDAFGPQVQAEINRRAYPAAAKRAQLAPGRLDDNAGLIGVARSAFVSLV